MTKPETPPPGIFPQNPTHKIENDITLFYCSYPITLPRIPFPNLSNLTLKPK